MVNQPLRIKMGYRSKEKEKEEKKENTRDRSVPYGSDKESRKDFSQKIDKN